MLGANEREEQSVLRMFVSSWPLSTAQGSFYLLYFHLGSRMQRLTRLILTVKNSLSLLAPYKTMWTILSVHVCAYTKECAHTHIWIYEIVLFMCTVYKAIMNLNVLFYLQKKKNSLLFSLVGQWLEAILDAWQPVQRMLWLQWEIHHLPAEAPLSTLWADLL